VHFNNLHAGWLTMSMLAITVRLIYIFFIFVGYGDRQRVKTIWQKYSEGPDQVSGCLPSEKINVCEES
jgi:hypothetical protein